MSNFDDVFKENFERSNLEGERWLEPNENILGKIHSAFDNEAKEEESDRKGIWIWYFSLALFTFIISIYFFNSTRNTQTFNVQNLNTETASIEQENKNQPFSKPESINAFKQKKSTVASKNISIERSKLIRKNPSKELIESTNLEQERIIKSEANFNGYKIKTDKNRPALNQTIDNKVNDTENIFKSSNLINISPVKDIAQSKTIEKLVQKERNLPKRNIEDLLYLENIAKPHIESKSKESEVFNVPTLNILESVQSKEKLNLVFATGVIAWKDRLNANYESALSPADFTDTNDFGYTIQLGLNKEVVKKVTLGIQAAYSSIKNKSGHNATLEYEESSEENLSNKYNDVTLATPYGFIKSKFDIKRSEAASETNVILNSSINSKHQIQLLSLGSHLNFKILNTRSLDISIGGNINYHHLLNIKNSLDFIDTRHGDFIYTNGEIISNQSFLKDGFWSTGITCSVSLNLTSKTSLGLSYMYNESISPLFKMNDFSSSPSIHQLNINFKLNL